MSLSNVTERVFLTEWYALQDFYISLRGTDWTYHNVSETSQIWNFTNPNINDPCADSWQGIECDCQSGWVSTDDQNDRNCVVQELQLGFFNLNGSISESIGNLTYLEKLVLNGNYLIEPIPESLGTLQYLVHLNLGDNFIRGEIPPFLVNLTSLEYLNLESNIFQSIRDETWNLPTVTGFFIGLNFLDATIPKTVCNLTSVRALSVVSNNFYSTIPNELYDLPYLEALILGFNYFNGSISNKISSFQNLSQFSISSNFFGGTIPSTLGNLLNLTLVNLANNNFYGPIPISFGNLQKLKDLTLTENLLSQSIPSTLGNLTELQTLLISRNAITGYYPSSLDQLKELLILELFENFLEGKIHDTVNSYSKISYLDIGENSFTGSIPFHSNWTILGVLEGNLNYFTGTIPTNMINLVYFNYFHFGQNYLTGIIPSLFGTNYQLDYVNISTNLLTGSIPESMDYLHKLGQLALFTNFLTGTLSANFGNMSSLVVLDLAQNKLHGTIPTSFISLKGLQVLFLDNNTFTGELHRLLRLVFYTPHLLNVDLSNNQFTGSLLSSFFSYQNLSSFAVGGNCLEGSIPESVCSMKTLTGLSFDGLTTAPNCRESIFWGFQAFTVKRFIHSSIPYCLFALPKLQTLHLSGNAFTGSIPSDLVISPTLQYLSMSHNILTGTIPNVMQLHQWNQIALSFNRLTGTLNPDFLPIPSDGHIYIELNRLSGRIPSVFRNTSVIEILEGNIFECNFDRSDLPKNDPKLQNYSCGSNAVNNLLAVYCSVFGVVLIGLIIVILRRYPYKNDDDADSENKKKRGKGIYETIHQWKLQLQSFWKMTSKYRSELKFIPTDETTGINPYFNLNNTSLFFHEVRMNFIYVTCFIVIVLMPCYSGISTYSNSYTFEYAWTISGLLLTGEYPGVVLSIGLSSLIILVSFLFNRLVTRTKGDLRSQFFKELAEKQGILHSQQKRKRIAEELKYKIELSYYAAKLSKIPVYILVALTNLTIALAIDIAYVYVFLNFSTTATVATQFFVAISRIVINNFLLWSMFPITVVFTRFLIQNHGSLRSFTFNYLKKASTLYTFTTRDVTFIDSAILFNNIIAPSVAILLVNPDCFYEAIYEANPVLSDYTYNICRRYVGQSTYCLKNVNETATTNEAYDPAFIYDYQCSSKIAINFSTVYIFMFLMVGIGIPLMKMILKYWYDSYPKENSNRKWIAMILPENLKDLRPKPKLIQRPIFAKLKITSQINSYLSILLCYGGLFPPLAIVATLTIICITLYEETVLGYILYCVRHSSSLLETKASELEDSLSRNEQQHQNHSDYSWYERQLELDASRISKPLRLTLHTIIFITCLFYSYLIFDTYGDQIGWKLALIPTMLMISLPFGLSFAKIIWVRYRQQITNLRLVNLLPRSAMVIDDKGNNSNKQLELIPGVSIRSTEHEANILRDNQTIVERNRSEFSQCATIVANPILDGISRAKRVNDSAERNPNLLPSTEGKASRNSQTDDFDRDSNASSEC